MEDGNYASVAAACEWQVLAAAEEEQDAGKNALRYPGQAGDALIGADCDLRSGNRGRLFAIVTPQRT
jgi:hypothetical protein